MSEKAFQREKQSFMMMEKEFSFRFIPSIHLQEILYNVLQLLLKVSVDPLDKSISLKEKKDETSVLTIFQELLVDRIYQVIADVLEYQNNEKVGIETLKRSTSPQEIAKFISMVITDTEVIDSIKELTTGLGKLIERAGIKPSQTASSTPSSSKNSDEIQSS